MPRRMPVPRPTEAETRADLAAAGITPGAADFRAIHRTATFLRDCTEIVEKWLDDTEIGSSRP